MPNTWLAFSWHLWDGWMDGWMIIFTIFIVFTILDTDSLFLDFRVLSRMSSIQPSSHHEGDRPLGILMRENAYYPESIEMRSMEMGSPYGHSMSGAPRSGYGKHL